MMSDPYDFDGVDFIEQGYFVFLDYTVDSTRGCDSYESPWELWVATLARARKGDFSMVSCLYDVYNGSCDYVLDVQCLELIGAAAPASILSKLRESTVKELGLAVENCDLKFIMDMSIVLFSQRRLADIPLLLEIYKHVVEYKDRVPVDTYIEDLLGRSFFEGGIHNLESNCELVESCYLELTRKYGPGDVTIWQGKPFTICGFARWMLANLDNVAMPYTARQIFEAYTGIDCRPFYKKREFQPLTMASIVEEFLDSPAVEKFNSDARYFFAHHLPD